MTHPVRTLLLICSAIKTFCRQTADYRDPTHNSSIQTYLRQHLPNRTWTSWQRLLSTDQDAFVYNQDALPTNGLSLERFRARLASFQKTGYGLFTFWPLAARTIGRDKSSDGVHNH